MLTEHCREATWPQYLSVALFPFQGAKEPVPSMLTEHCREATWPRYVKKAGKSTFESMEMQAGLSIPPPVEPGLK